MNTAKSNPPESGSGCQRESESEEGLVFDPPLDAKIQRAVVVLCQAGIETFESCEGGAGHAYPSPTVRFHGNSAAGWRALAAAKDAGLPVYSLGRVWPVNEGEPTGPYWEIIFYPCIT